jgi:hypothetical protein
MKGHISRECPEPEEKRLPAEERAWRADYAAMMVAQRSAERDAQIAAIEEVQGEGNGEESTQ